jgi:hypothetical protein
MVSSKGASWLSRWENMYSKKFKETLLVFWKEKEINLALVLGKIAVNWWRGSPRRLWSHFSSWVKASESMITLVST